MELFWKCLLMGMLLVSVTAKPMKLGEMARSRVQPEGDLLLEESLSEAADISQKKEDILEKTEEMLEEAEDIREEADDIREETDDIREETDNIREKEATDADWEAYRKTLFERAGFEGENGWTRPLFNGFLDKYSELVSSGVPDHNIRFDHNLRIYSELPIPAEKEKYKELYNIVKEFYENKGSEASLAYLSEKIGELKEAGADPVQLANDLVGDVAAMVYINKEEVSRAVKYFLEEYKTSLFGKIFEEASTGEVSEEGRRVPTPEKLTL